MPRDEMQENSESCRSSQGGNVQVPAETRNQKGFTTTSMTIAIISRVGASFIIRQ